AEDGIRDLYVTGVQTCALPIYRSRLTADGMWYLCLYAAKGIDLRAALRGGVSAEEVASLIRRGWQARDDRGAEQRLALGDRRARSEERRVGKECRAGGWR